MIYDEKEVLKHRNLNVQQSVNNPFPKQPGIINF